ncbi:MAG: metallophosphoesterase family protein [Ruminococcus callidus]
MKILHLSDLHLGRRLYTIRFFRSRKMLEQVVKIAVEQSVQAVLIVGDVYDKNVPAAEAVTVLDSFLTALSEKKIAVFISGNHDSAERLQFASQLLNTRACILPGRFPVRCRYDLKMNTEKCISACCPLHRRRCRRCIEREFPQPVRRHCPCDRADGAFGKGSESADVPRFCAA